MRGLEMSRFQAFECGVFPAGAERGRGQGGSENHKSATDQHGYSLADMCKRKGGIAKTAARSYLTMVRKPEDLNAVNIPVRRFASMYTTFPTSCITVNGSLHLLVPPGEDCSASLFSSSVLPELAW